MRTHLHLLFASLLLSLAALALALPARAGEAAEQPAILTLVVNEGKHGEVTVLLRGDEIWVAQEDLERAGFARPAGRTEVVRGRAHVALSSIQPPLDARVDEGDLTLRIHADPSALRSSAISMRPSAPPGLASRGDLSAFFNYGTHLVDVHDIEATGEAGVSYGGGLLSSTFTATPRGAVRGLSSLSVDHPREMLRLTLGDAFVSGGPLGGGLVSGGVTIARNFALDPYFVSQPSFGYAANALTPSTLDVYVNGVLMRSEPVTPGPVRLDNVPVPSGAGEVRYVLRDAFGREQSTVSPYFLSSSLLGRGISEYTYSFGAKRGSLATRSFDYGDLGFLGAHRYGISNALTAGARLEASLGVVSGGGSISAIIPIGQLDLGVAASASQGRLGGAAYASYFYSARRFGASISARVASDAYATLSLSPTDRRNLVEVNASTSITVARGVSLASRYAFALDRDTGPTFRLGVSTGFEIRKGINLLVSAGRSLRTDGSAPFDVLATVGFSLGAMRRASLGAQLQNGKPQAVADLSSPLPRGEGTGYRATALLGENPQGQGTAMLQTSFGRYQATGAYGADGPHLVLEAAGAVVAVKGAGVFLGRPVQEGFAVVQVPGQKGVRAYADNHEIGSTDGDGNVLVPDLLPYYGNRLRVADQDLRLDAAIGDTEQLVAPTFRGGALVRFEAKVMRYVRGKIQIVAGGEPFVPAYGELVIRTPEGEISSPIGEGGEIELEGPPSGRHPAVARFSGAECSFEIEIPDRAGSVIELGAISCAREAVPSSVRRRRR